MNRNLMGVKMLMFCLLMGSVEAAIPYVPQSSDPIREPWRWQTFPELDGKGLQCLARGNDGVMWFGVNDGVMQYDGMTWILYTPAEGLVGAPINSLCVTGSGDIYAGSDAGISRYDSKGKWQRVFPFEGDLPWSVFSIVESQDGTLWAGTAWGALHIGQERSVLYTIREKSDAIQALVPWLRIEIVSDAAVNSRAWRTGTGMRVVEGIAPISSVVWNVAPGGPAEQAGIRVGDRITAVNHHPRVTNNQTDGEADSQVILSVARVSDPDTFHVELTRSRVDGNFREFHVYSVQEDLAGRMWFGLGTRLLGGEVISWQKHKGHSVADAWRQFPNTFLPGPRPTFAQTSDGILWVVNALQDVGIQMFDGTTWRETSLVELDVQMGMTGPAITANQHRSIAQTRDGTVWVGGNSGRVHTWRNGKWAVYAFPDVPIPLVRIIGIADGSPGIVWVGGLAQQAARLDYGSSRWMGYTDLKFQCETPDGTQWFIGDLSVVAFDGQEWVAYGVSDGLMTHPRALFVTRNGRLWVAGRDRDRAATAQFDGRQWGRFEVHSEFSSDIYAGAIFESDNGDIWLGDGFSAERYPELAGGVLQYNGKGWIQHRPPETPYYVYAITQAEDGAIWLGGSSIRRYDGHKWTSVVGPPELARWGTAGTVEAMQTDAQGDIWLGTRAYGIYQYDTEKWVRHDVSNGLADNTVKALAQTLDGNIWVATDKGVSRFDGETWTTHGLPVELVPIEKFGLKVTKDGTVWINRPGALGTVRYAPDRESPETSIVESVDEVAQPGNVTIGWKGSDFWADTAEDNLQFSWRLDDEPWSPFEYRMAKTLLEVPGGTHVLEVKARDRDFNEDPIPARVVFTVIPPIYQQPWFVGLMGILIGLIGVQTTRVVARDRRLQAANAALGEQNHALSNARAAAEAASESKSAFLANMSHEIRTPLNAILGYARLLLRRGEQGVDIRQSIGTIESSGTHLLALINNILDLSRIESGRLELEQSDFDLKGMAEDIRAMFSVSCQEKGIEWQVGWRNSDGQVMESPERVDVYGDGAKLRQVLINLVGNAVKFAPGGRVVLSLSRLPDEKLPIYQDRYHFEVHDTGRGIHPDDQAAIFEPFEQGTHGVRTGGTGLGLAIARRYIQLMGSELELESELGSGSRFFFAVPFAPAEHAPLSQGAGSENQVIALAKGHTLDVLVADDVLENRQVLSQILTSIGATVRTVDNGHEAVEAVADKRPDIVLMDIWMPVMDGREATRRIKSTYGDDAPVVVAVSASVLAHEQREFRSAGFDDFITKPVHEGRLFASMARFLPVEYLYQEDVQTSLDLAAVKLPARLYENLRQAAEFGEVTQLEALIEEVRKLGVDAQPIADQLWRLSRRLDLDAIIKLLDEVGHGV